MNEMRPCRVCKTEFVAKKANACYCSVECRDNPQFKYQRAIKRRGKKICKKCGLKYSGPNYFFCKTCHTNMSWVHDADSITIG